MNTAKDQPTPFGADTAHVNAGRARRVMQEVAAEAMIPGMSVAVAGPQGILFADAVGYADLAERRPASVRDQYLWFSMSKIATASAVMRLHADGVLDLDAPIGTYLPGYRPHAKHGHPTTRQLLSHTAGLANPLPIRWIRREGEPENRAMLSRILEKYGTPRSEVGVRAAYSNIGYLLAAAVVEAATGRSIQQCVSDAVLKPLAMSETGYGYRPQAPRSIGYVRLHRALVPLLRWALPNGIVGPRVDGYTSLHPFLVSGAGYGGLVGNVRDAAILAAAHAGGSPKRGPFLPAADIQQMRTIASTGRPFDHGIGWFRKPADAQRTPAFVEHYGTGGGFWNAMRIYPGLSLAMVAMTNTTSKWNFDELFTRLVDLSWH